MHAKHDETPERPASDLWSATRDLVADTETVIHSGIDLALAANRAATTEIYRQTETIAAVTRPFVETTTAMSQRLVGMARDQADRIFDRIWS